MFYANICFWLLFVQYDIVLYPCVLKNRMRKNAKRVRVKNAEGQEKANL